MSALFLYVLCVRVCVLWLFGCVSPCVCVSGWLSVWLSLCLPACMSACMPCADVCHVLQVDHQEVSKASHPSSKALAALIPLSRVTVGDVIKAQPPARRFVQASLAPSLTESSWRSKDLTSLPEPVGKRMPAQPSFLAPAHSSLGPLPAMPAPSAKQRSGPSPYQSPYGQRSLGKPKLK